jgi:integrase/recombinase XerD
LLAVIPDTPTGLLDRAMIVTAVLTGLRRSEVAELQVIAPARSGTPRYEVRIKGGSVRRRELPGPAWEAILAAADAAGRAVGAEGVRAFPASAGTFNAHLRRHVEAAGLGRVSCHVLRHTAAKLRRRTGASIEEVCALLGHRSIATTATYLCQLEDERDDGWGDVASSLGLLGRIPLPSDVCTWLQ